MSEHPVDQPIHLVAICIEGDTHLSHTVGAAGVTRIEACTKSGMHAEIPYVRVWAGDRCVAEFCQHNIIGVYFGKAEPTDG